MSKFGLPKRFDEKIADEGIWIEGYDENLNHSYGFFKLTLIDQNSKRCKKFFTDYNRRNKIKTGRPLSPEESMNQLVELFVDLGIVDWRSGVDEKGRNLPFKPGNVEIEFNRENAIDFFSDPDAYNVFETCQRFASQYSNFRAETKEELLGN